MQLGVLCLATGAAHSICGTLPWQDVQAASSATRPLASFPPAVVAMSRARLGLYIFGRASLFSNCFELRPTFSQLLARPVQLALVPGEYYGACQRPLDAPPPPAQLVSGVAHMAGIVQHMAQQWEAAAAEWARANASAAAPAAGAVEQAVADAVEQAVAATAPLPEEQPAAEEGAGGDEEHDGEEGEEGGEEAADDDEEEGGSSSGEEDEDDGAEAPMQQD